MRGTKWIPALLALGAVPLAAQEPKCNDANAQVQAACNAAGDAYATFQPLAGIAISGGSPELGTARALGGLGHLFASIRVNAVKATVPNPDTTQAPISGGVPAPVVEAGLGIWPGLSGGLLAVDALGSATLLPTGLDKLSVDSNAARVGQVAFVNAGLDLMAAKLVGELGYQTGKDQNLSRNYTAFDPKAGHVYGGVGFRISF